MRDGWRGWSPAMCKGAWKRERVNERCGAAEFVGTRGCQSVLGAEKGQKDTDGMGVGDQSVSVKLHLWTALPPLAEGIRRGQPAHTPPQRPP
eukprot:235131-Chlamydomonas_euryale.AAC.1